MADRTTARKASPFTMLLGAGALIAGFFTMVTAGQSADTGAVESVRETAGPLVDTVKAKTVPGSYRITAPGRLRARQGIAVIGEVAGKIVEVGDRFQVGARLEAGDLLFRIDQTDYKATVKSAEASLQSAKASLVQARKSYNRRKDLVESGVVSDQANDDALATLTNARAGVKQAEAQLEQARANLARTEVYSPYPARILEESVSIGTYVAPGQQLGIITDTRLAELIAGLTPRDSKAVAEALAAGKTVKARAVPNSGSVSTGTLEGTVYGFTSQVDAASRTAQVVALFPDAFEPQYSGKIFGDDFMTLEIEIASDAVVWQVPAGTVRKDKMVWAIDANNKLVPLDVTVLSRTRGATLISTDAELSGKSLMVTLLNEEYAGLEVTPNKAVAASTSTAQ